MMLFYLVRYMFGNMGAFLVVEAGRAVRAFRSIDAYRGLAQRSPLLALAMLIFLLSLGGIPFVAGFWASSTCSGQRSNAGCTAWCSSAPS
jgi:NADH:ubiquinone oxidoreductase subunit 2 (subunit N)